jgi:hypothetical protein
LQTFEIEMLAEQGNFVGLDGSTGRGSAGAKTKDPGFRVVVDRDFAGFPVYEGPEQSANNGHLESAGYHLQLLFSGEGDRLAAMLRPGNVHSAEGVFTL